MSNTIKNFDVKVDETYHKLDQALFEYISIWETIQSTDEIKDKVINYIDYLTSISSSNKKREIVDINSLKYDSIMEFDSRYKEIQNIITKYDPEKKFATHRYIFQRKSDKKYFSLEYQDWGTGQDNLEEKNLKEVFLVDLKIKKVFR